MTPKKPKMTDQAKPCLPLNDKDSKCPKCGRWGWGACSDIPNCPNAEPAPAPVDDPNETCHANTQAGSPPPLKTPAPAEECKADNQRILERLAEVSEAAGHSLKTWGTAGAGAALRKSMMALEAILAKGDKP